MNFAPASKIVTAAFRKVQGYFSARDQIVASPYADLIIETVENHYVGTSFFNDLVSKQTILNVW